MANFLPIAPYNGIRRLHVLMHSLVSCNDTSAAASISCYSKHVLYVNMCITFVRYFNFAIFIMSIDGVI